MNVILRVKMTVIFRANMSFYKIDPIPGFSIALFVKMCELSKTSPGMFDLLKQAKSFYELSGGELPNDK